MKVKRNYLNEKGLLNCLPQDVFIDIIKSSSRTIVIDDAIFEEAQRELKRRKDVSRAFDDISNYNNKGIRYEKSGMIETAVLEYEKCMKVMYEGIENGLLFEFAWHAPNRLRILYKKEKHPHEERFLQDFIKFCLNNHIKYPDSFEKQLNRFQ